MNDLNLLMARIDEINAKSPPYTEEDIVTTIAYHRRSRANRAAGIKPERPKIDLEAIMGGITQSKPTTTSAFKGRRL
jgi:hypothetical protein